MGAGPSRASVAKKEAKVLFNAIDVNHDGKVTLKELCDAAEKHGEQIQAVWTQARIRDIMERYDTSKKGHLTLPQFRLALESLYAEDSGVVRLRKTARRMMGLGSVLPAQPPPYQPDSGTAEQRDAISEIIEGALYLTNFRGAESRSELRRLAVTHVMSVGSEFQGSEPLADLGIKYWQTDVTDDEEQAPVMRQALNAAVNSIRAALAEGGRVLVHCAAGISRSATVVIAYLMLADGFTLKNAFEYTIGRRPVIWPNNGFMGLLISLERDKGQGKKPVTISLAAYTRWGDFDQKAYHAARVLDRESRSSFVCDPPASKQARTDISNACDR